MTTDGAIRAAWQLCDDVSAQGWDGDSISFEFLPSIHAALEAEFAAPHDVWEQRGLGLLCVRVLLDDSVEGELATVVAAGWK